MTRKKLISFSFIILILLLTVGIVSAQDNETQAILENATPVDEGKTFENVQAALDNASENDTIELEGTYMGRGKAINITKSVTIKSENGATLDAGSKSNILNIANVTVFLKNINFINSRTISDAAISSQGNLTIENCNFTHNEVRFDEYKNYKYYEDYGGAIYSTNSLTVMNSRFEDNHAESSRVEQEETDANPIYWEYRYAGAICSQNDAVIENCYFKDSSVICRGESIIANSTFTKTTDVLETSSHAKISNCNFTQNRGISIKPNGKTIIGNCNFMNNTNDFTLIYSYGNVEITDSNFTLSDAISIFSANYLHVANCRFENNNQTAIKATNATVENSIFTNNKDSLVGGILADYLTVKNCNFTNNLECDVISIMSADVDGKSYLGETAFDSNMNKTALMKMVLKNTAIVYGSGKTMQITLTFIKSGNKVGNYRIAYNLLKNNKRMGVDEGWDYDYTIHGENGTANFKIPTLNVGSYKIQIIGDPTGFSMKKTITFKITKAGTIIKAPKVTAKYKKSKYFKVLVKHKTTKKVVKNTYVKIKIDKKTYKVKTDSKGIAKVNTKNLKVGKHKVEITSGNTNYKMSAKSTIIIKR